MIKQETHGHLGISKDIIIAYRQTHEGHAIYNVGRPYFGHQYYIHNPNQKNYKIVDYGFSTFVLLAIDTNNL